MTSVQERKYLSISLAKKDEGHLVKFLNALEATHEIKNYYGRHSYCRVIIEDESLFNDLSSLGVVPRKSLVVRFPKLKKSLRVPFIRGYFDGNGCISKHRTRYGTDEYEFNITSTKEMLESAIKILPVSSEVKIINRHGSFKNNFTVKFCGNQQTYRVMNLLYGNASIYLDRKYDRYIQLVTRVSCLQGKPCRV